MSVDIYLIVGDRRRVDDEFVQSSFERERAAFDLAGSSGPFSRFVAPLVAVAFLPNGKRSAFIGFFIRSSVLSCVYAIVDIEDGCELRGRLRASMTTVSPRSSI